MSAADGLNPLTPMAWLLALGTGAALLLDGGALLGLHAWVVLVLIAGLRVGPGELALGHLVLTPFAAGVLLTNAVSRGGEVIAAVGPLEVTDEGVRVGASLALRVLVVAVPAMAVARRVDPSRLVIALMQHLRVRPRAGFALLTAHRMLADMPGRWRLLLAAGAVRAPLNNRGRPRLGVRGHGRAALGLLVGGVRRGNEIADALDVRGVGAARRTSRRQEPFRRRDAVVLGAVTAGGAVAAWVGAAAGG